MEATSRAVSIPVPEPDLLTQVLRQGAQRMLAQAIEGEAAEWIEPHRPQLFDNISLKNLCQHCQPICRGGALQGNLAQRKNQHLPHVPAPTLRVRSPSDLTTARR
jgi:hypothetical protein